MQHLSDFTVEEWLKIQPNTPCKLSTCTGMSWGVTYGLVKCNSWKHSLYSWRISPQGSVTNSKCCCCDFSVTKVTSSPVLYPNKTGMNQLDSPFQQQPSHPWVSSEYLILYLLNTLWLLHMVSLKGMQIHGKWIHNKGGVNTLWVCVYVCVSSPPGVWAPPIVGGRDRRGLTGRYEEGWRFLFA